MTTKKEKKGVKKAKSAKREKTAAKIVKRPDAGSERKKMVVKNPKASEVDKDKMAAFFSAAGLKETVPVEKPVPVTPAVVPAPSAEARVVVADEPEAPAVAVEKTIIEAQVPEAEVAVASPPSETENIKEEIKGEIEMTTTETAETTSQKSDSSSFSTMPLFVVLFCLAAFWFYYISAAPIKKAAAVQVEQSQTKIQSLEAQVKTLQTQIDVLQAKLAALSIPVREVKVKQAATTKAPPKDASFDKAPIPFWRTMQHPHAEQLQKSQQKRVSAATAKSEKVDSFSKAPVPFWRKAAVGNKGVQAEKGVNVKKNQSSSFDKAPIPFWRK